MNVRRSSGKNSSLASLAPSMIVSTCAGQRLAPRHVALPIGDLLLPTLRLPRPRPLSLLAAYARDAAEGGLDRPARSAVRAEWRAASGDPRCSPSLTAGYP